MPVMELTFNELLTRLHDKLQEELGQKNVHEPLFQQLRDRIAELEKELALLDEALDGAALDYYSDHEHPQYGYGAHTRQQIRKGWLCEAQMMLDVKARQGDQP